MLYERLVRLVGFLRCLLRLRDSRWARVLSRNSIDPSYFLSCGREGELRLRDHGITLSLAESWAIKAFEPLMSLVTAGAAFDKTAEGSLVMRLGGLRVMAETPQDILAMNEILVEGCYNFHLPDRCAVLDIGMNVGVASLFFALKDEVETVYSYELFDPTYRQAERNIELNASLKKKIHMVNYGVGFPSRTMNLPYSYELKGSIGTNGIEPEAVLIFKSERVESRTVEVQIKDCAEVVAEVRRKAAGKELVVKMDCEGSEYEIMERLGSQGLVREISMYIIEWHKRGPEPIVEILGRHGFTVISLKPGSNYVGMVYAWRA